MSDEAIGFFMGRCRIHSGRFSQGAHAVLRRGVSVVGDWGVFAWGCAVRPKSERRVRYEVLFSTLMVCLVVVMLEYEARDMLAYLALIFGIEAVFADFEHRRREARKEVGDGK